MALDGDAQSLRGVAVATRLPDGKGERPYRRFIVLLFPLFTALTAAIQGVQQILIPAQVEAIDPASKIANLGQVTAVAAAAAMAGLLAGGMVSDRTSGRWGRRTPSIVVGAATSAGLMLTLPGTNEMIALTTLFALLWFTLNYYQGALLPTLPDRVPPVHRGVASSVVAVAMPLGVIGGVNLASRLSPFSAYACLAGAVLLATVGLLVLEREVPAAAAPRSAGGGWATRARVAIGLSVSAFRSWDFSVVFAARAAMFFSVWNVNGYIYYLTQDLIGVHNLPGHDPQLAVSMLLTVQMAACLVSAAGAGFIADRLGRVKLLVAICSLGIAGSLLLPLIFRSWGGMLAMELCVGLFFGGYLAVDLALMTLVLPSRLDEGKDMAILNLATGGPQILSPLTGAALIGAFGYSSLFAFGSAIAAIAGLLVLLVRRIP